MVRAPINEPEKDLEKAISAAETEAEDVEENESIEEENETVVAPVKEFCPPMRLDYGKNGYQVALRVNYFQLKMPVIEIHHYHVEVTPAVNREVNRQLVMKLIRTFPVYFENAGVVYDGRNNMYTKNPVKLGADEMNFEIAIPESNCPFKILIRSEGIIDTSYLEKDAENNAPFLSPAAYHAVDVILRHCSSFRFTPLGRSFFAPPGPFALGCPINGATSNLGQGRELWFGFHQSLRQTQMKMMVNIDVSTTTFYEAQPVVEFLASVLDLPMLVLAQRTQLSDAQRLRFYRQIKTLKVEVTHCGEMRRKYRVTSLTRKPAQTQTFPMTNEDGFETEMTVVKYFFDRYGMELKYPHLPCLQVGDEKKTTYLPIEVCRIVAGQRCATKLSDLQTSTMIRASVKNAPEREKEILELMGKSQLCEDPVIEQFGISISPSMTKIQGRVLPPPKLVYANKYSKSKGMAYQSCVPHDGVWDMRNKCLHQGVSVHTWALISFASREVIKECDLRLFTSELQRVSNDTGMPICENPMFCKFAAGVEQVEPMFRYLKKSHPDLQMIVVILPGKTSIYAEIKKVGDVLLGIPTQCIAMKNVIKPSTQCLSNLCLKMNVKIGGTNTVVLPSIRSKIFEEPVIFIGADVSHPSNSNDANVKRPTVCSVVGSMDAHPSRFAAAIRLQKAKQEMIGELADMVRELLIKFRKSTGFRPMRIVMYRSGVSEGQYYNCLQHEVRAIREACMSIEAGYQPGVTYIIVQKRHHTRLFAAHPQNFTGRANNVPAGTIVDSGITHPSQNDFYLCSHAGIQGTSRPTRYHVLWDDNSLTADDLHELTYHLCHTYARCTRAVSIPAPVYYAHLVGFRARYHLTDRCQTESSYVESLYSTASSTESATTTLQQMTNAIKVHPAAEKVMYFA